MSPSPGTVSLSCPCSLLCSSVRLFLRRQIQVFLARPVIDQWLAPSCLKVEVPLHACPGWD